MLVVGQRLVGAGPARVDALFADDNLEGERDSIVEDIRALGEEQSDKLSNMPDGLQQAPTGEMLQNRADACEDWASEIEKRGSGWFRR